MLDQEARLRLWEQWKTLPEWAKFVIAIGDYHDHPLTEGCYCYNDLTQFYVNMWRRVVKEVTEAREV